MLLRFTHYALALLAVKGALALAPPPAKPALSSTTTRTDLAADPTTASPTATQDAWAPLYLHVSATPPDPLGISKVSGFYGPGSWAAWFLTICGSWLHLWVDHSGSYLDVSAWSYLAYTNWAAIALIRHSIPLYALKSEKDTAGWVENAGQTAAALTIVFFGCLHGTAQWVRCGNTVESGRGLQRLRTLLAGLFLPVLALMVFCVCAVSFHPVNTKEVVYHIPALYWRGMDPSARLFAVFSLGYLVCLLYCFVIILMCSRFCPSVHFRSTHVPAIIRMHSLQCFLVAAGLIVYFVVLPVLLSIPRSLLFILILPPVMFINLIFIYFFVPIVSTVYVFKAYLLHSTPPSQSCYFMPCTPQSILDHDQLGAFFVGAIVFLGPEVAYPLFQYLKRRQRERRTLRRDLDDAARMIELARMNREDECGENAPPLVRAASGFEAEDGAASARNTAGRVG
jgi:hypothetical protein